MREIEIDTYPFQGFSSPETAIAHAKASSLLAKAKGDEPFVRGSHLIDASWNDTDFFIRFSNGHHLHIFVDPKSDQDGVEWCVGHEESTISLNEFEQVGSPAVLLRFPKGGDYKMDRSALIAARRGKEIKALFAGDIGFLLYTPQQPILRFSCVFRKDNRQNLLYVSETQ